MVIFENRDQFIIIPAVGLVFDDSYLYLTVAIFFYGVSIWLCRWKC